MDHPAERQTPSRPRGIRTTLLSLVALSALAAIIIGVLIFSLKAPPQSLPGAGESAGPGKGSADASASGGPAIAGRISVAPALAGRVGAAHVLFIIARRGAGPPFAVKRIGEPHFPLRYRLGPENVMMAGTPFSGDVTLTARLSVTGGAGPAQPGDLEGEHPGTVPVGAEDADIVIDRVD